MDMNSDDAPDWKPAVSANKLPNGLRRRGSTGQLFQVLNGQWIRVRKADQPHIVLVDPVSTGFMISMEFSKHGAYARKHWDGGKIEEISVEQAMKEFDQLAASGAFERSSG